MTSAAEIAPPQIQSTASQQSPTTPTPRIGVKAVLATLFVGGLAFLLASFPVRNAEIWGYLAAGRDLANGRVPTALASWSPDRNVGEGWLFDLVSYAIYSVAGGSGLVFTKALLVAALAAILLWLSRSGAGWLLPTVCTGLAVLAMGSRLLFQPAIISYLGLAVALLVISVRSSPEDKAAFLPPWPLLLIFFVWANVDRWYLLGIGVVALVWIGRLIDAPGDDRAKVMTRRVVSLCLLIAVCLLNPAHFRGFALPPDLTVSGPVPGGLVGVRSPFTAAYWDAMSQSPVGLAYFPLLGLSLISFFLTLPRWSWERFLPWVGLAALSAYQVRTVPFFAVVAGPVLAWNLRDFFDRRRPIAIDATGLKPTRLPGSKYVRVILGGGIGLLALAFLGCAWVGWLQSPPFEPRRWAIETPPGLQRSAEAMCALPAEGAVLHLSPDTAAGFAWFCPDRRAVRDPDLMAAVLGESTVADGWRERMRSAGISHVVIYDTDRARWHAAVERLLANSRQWMLVAIEGRATVFEWRDPTLSSPKAIETELSSELDRLTVWPKPEEKAPATPKASSRRWWQALWKPAPEPSGDRDEAAVRLLQAEAHRRSVGVRHLAAWEATQLAGLIGSSAGWNSPAAANDANARLIYFRPPLQDTGSSTHPLGQLALLHYSPFVSNRDDSPLAVLYLAIRSARRAVSRNPGDALAYALLGDAYLRLIHNTRERAWGRVLPQLISLRRAQAVAAFHRALTIDPNLALAHSQLGTMYLDLGFLDLALHHQRAFLAILRKSAKAGGAAADDLRNAIAGAERQLEALAQGVEQQTIEFEREAEGLRVLDRALAARDRGLVGKARDILLNSDISAFGANGLALELELLIRTGRADEVRNWTSPEQQEALGARYHWLRVQALAATGEYALAQIECSGLAIEGTDSAGVVPRQLAAVLVAREILDANDQVRGISHLAWAAFRQAAFRNQLLQLVVHIRRQSDAIALRGVLAIEAGETESAVADFRQALATWGGPASVADGSGIDFNGRRLCHDLLEWIESTSKR